MKLPIHAGIKVEGTNGDGTYCHVSVNATEDYTFTLWNYVCPAIEIEVDSLKSVTDKDINQSKFVVRIHIGGKT